MTTNRLAKCTSSTYSWQSVGKHIQIIVVIHSNSWRRHILSETYEVLCMAAFTGYRYISPWCSPLFQGTNWSNWSLSIGVRGIRWDPSGHAHNLVGTHTWRLSTNPFLIENAWQSSTVGRFSASKWIYCEECWGPSPQIAVFMIRRIEGSPFLMVLARS